MAQQSKGYVDVPMTPAERKLAEASYEDVPMEETSSTASPKGSTLEEMLTSNPPLNIAIGQAKGLGRTLYGGAKAVTNLVAPGTLGETPKFLEPSNTMQSIGGGIEQAAEFLASPAKSLVGRMIGDAALTYAQTGGDAAMAGVTGALTGGLGAAGKVAGQFAGTMQRSAEKSMGRALGATKDWAKSDAQKIIPEMLARGTHGTRPQMLEAAKTAAQKTGKALDAAYAAASEAGATIPGKAIKGDLQIAKTGLMVQDAYGGLTPIAGTEGVIKKLDDLEQFVTTLGDDIPVDRAWKVRKTWDKIVSKAGLYGPKAASTATDAESAWSFREGASSFRSLLEGVPNVAELSKEYAFQNSLKNVLKETQKRTISQTGGLGAMIGGTAGAATGYASGDSVTGGLTGAFVGAAGARNFIRLMQSPYWQSSVSAPLKKQMADALASGSKGQATGVLSRMLASLPAQARNAFKESE